LKIPTQFQLAGNIWQVVQLEELEGGALGLTRRDKLSIELKKKQPVTAKEATLIHEMLHAIKYTQGVTDNHDEVEIEALAQYLHQALTSMK
jgi:hypothetical protein